MRTTKRFRLLAINDAAIRFVIRQMTWCSPILKWFSTWKKRLVDDLLLFVQEFAIPKHQEGSVKIDLVNMRMWVGRISISVWSYPDFISSHWFAIVSQTSGADIKSQSITMLVCVSFLSLTITDWLLRWRNTQVGKLLGFSEQESSLF